MSKKCKNERVKIEERAQFFDDLTAQFPMNTGYGQTAKKLRQQRIDRSEKIGRKPSN